MKNQTEKILQMVKSGEMSVEDALLQLKNSPSKIWVTLTSTITAPSDKALKKLYSGKAKRLNKLSALQQTWLPTG